MSFRALVVVCLSLLPGAACALGLIVPQHVEGDPGCVDVLEQAVRVTIDPGGHARSRRCAFAWRRIARSTCWR